MAGPTTAALNLAADGVASAVTATSLHSADPGTTGASELSTAGAVYARQTPTFSAATGGVANLASALTFGVPGGATVAYYGHWAGATFLGGQVAASPAETYGSNGQFRLDNAPVVGTAGA